MGVVEMTVNDLLGEGEWSVEPDVSVGYNVVR
jgi:hypothetical protein